MKKRWQFGLLALALSISLVLSACGSGNSGSGESSSGEESGASDESGGGAESPGGEGLIEISMYHSFSTDTDRGRALADLIDRYNREREGSIKVVVDINPDFPAYQEKVKSMIAGDQTPDVFHYNFNPSDLSRQNSGKLMDFTPHMDSEWRGRFAQSDLELLTINGELTSIPFEKAGALLYYNRAHFDAAGIAAFPKTWDEMLTACEKLEATGVTPFSLYTADDAWYTCNLLTYLAASQGGIEMFSGTGDLYTPEMEAAAEYLRRFFGYTTSDAVGANYSVAMNHFSAGQTAMAIDGPWLIGMLDEGILDSIELAPAPTMGDGKVSHGFTVTDAQTPLACAKQSDPSKEAAIVDFMKYLTSVESANYLTLEGQVFLSPQIDLSQEQLDGAGMIAKYIEVNSLAGESIVNIQRGLTTSANAKLPSLLESLFLDLTDAQEFADGLQEANQES